MKKLILICFLLISINAFSASMEIQSQGGFYKAILRETIEKDEKSDLLNLYKSTKSQEISAPTAEGTISRKLIMNNGQNFKFACIYLDNFKTDGSKDFQCEFYSERFENNYYEVEYYESSHKELYLTFHAENAKDLIKRLGLSTRVNLNLGDKVELTGDDQTLYLSIKE